MCSSATSPPNSSTPSSVPALARLTQHGGRGRIQPLWHKSPTAESHQGCQPIVAAYPVKKAGHEMTGKERGGNPECKAHKNLPERAAKNHGHHTGRLLAAYCC